LEERGITMNSARSPHRGYVLATLLGAIRGGVAVAIATEAIFKIMSAMMQNMMARMGENGCSPGEM
jgi:CheY-specific phosphatase CheX